MSAKELVTTLNQKLRAEVPETIGFAFGPPAIPGLGTAGGFSFMLQDRSGGTVEQLYGNLEKFVVAARKRPELSPLITTFRPSVPQLYVDRSDRVPKQGLQFGDVSDAAGAGEGISTSSIASTPVEGVIAGRTRISNQRDKINNLCSQFKGRDTPPPRWSQSSESRV
jgi:multidrug efflux pump subunit AcrB